jgi:hypothetical protein
MHYEVPGMQLFTQDKDMACWFASAMMVISWAELNRPNPFRNQCTAVDQQTIDLYKANHGIQNPQILPLARRLGLVPVPPMSPTPEALEGWLRAYGPLWTNGVSHIVVIAGIGGDSFSGYTVKVYDPWPGIGIEWRSLAGWYTGFDPGNRGASSRDISRDVQAVFLRAA